MTSLKLPSPIAGRQMNLLFDAKRSEGLSVKSHRTLTPCFASRNDPSDGAETGSAELHIAEQSRSRRAVIGDREVMRGS